MGIYFKHYIMLMVEALFFNCPGYQNSESSNKIKNISRSYHFESFTTTVIFIFLIPF